jgi:predicted HicB family RNase H-like nuclease
LSAAHPHWSGNAATGKSYSGKFLVRIPPALHRKAALQSAARGESLNQFVADALAGA